MRLLHTLNPNEMNHLVAKPNSSNFYLYLSLANLANFKSFPLILVALLAFHTFQEYQLTRALFAHSKFIFFFTILLPLC